MNPQPSFPPSNTRRIPRFLSHFLKCPATWQIIRVIIIVQSIPVIWTYFVHFDKLHQAQILFGLNFNQLLANKFWQPLSYPIIHGGWLHLTFNAVLILLFGSKIEHIFPKRSIWLLTLYAILAGATFFLVFDALSTTPAKTLVGASPICFAFLVFYTTLSPQSRFLPFFLSGRSTGLIVIITSLILAIIDPSLPFSPLKNSSTFPSELFHISHSCHLGGTLAGWFYARYILRPRISIKSLQKARTKSESTPST